jgi:DNA ligase 1
MVPVLLQRLVDVHARVRRTRSRNDKRDLLAALLAEAEPTELALVATYLSGRLRQRRTGLGWQSWGAAPAPADTATLVLSDVDAAFESMSAATGQGSRGARAALLSDLLARATQDEQDYLRALALGEVRQGALDSVLLDAIAAATSVPPATVRRAAMFTPDSGDVALAAATGGAEALRRIGLQPGRALRPMLAGTAPDVRAALAAIPPGSGCYVDRKLDGVRVQVHRVGDDVRIYTRSLDEITDRLPRVVAAARRLPASQVVLDGEVLLVADGRPRPFQETASVVGQLSAADDPRLQVSFFDLLHLDGDDLLDRPLGDRIARLDPLLSDELLVPRLHLPDPADDRQADLASRFFDDTVSSGHEGVIVKDAAAPYAAGRRGGAWVKVKPRHTLDLVVIAVEWGSGRRAGLLSNIHLAARGPGGDPVMLGKTFKGMTDEMLQWQTERFLALETGRSGHVVHVRPEQVVEVAIDGVQSSSRYPGQVALRFARVLRYRDDKSADEADTIETLRDLLT